MTPTLEIILGIAAGGTALCAWIARPRRKKPVDMTDARVTNLKARIAENKRRKKRYRHLQIELSRITHEAMQTSRAQGWRQSQ
jgi:hypothetical protein